MKELPTELWMYIFSFSCMDDGRTGCALQLVSRTTRELSRPFRYTSVSLKRSKHILQFESVITELPPDLRRVRYLHITSPHLFLDVSDDEDDESYYEISEYGSGPDGDGSSAEATLDESGGDCTMENEGADEDWATDTNSDEDEYQPLSGAEEAEVFDDVTYLSSTSDEDTIPHTFDGREIAEYYADMGIGNDVVLASVRHIIATVWRTLCGLSIHWTKEFNSGYLSIPDFISFPLPCLTELYLCVNLRSYTSDPIRDTYPESMFHQEYHIPMKFEGLTFPALRRLRFAGLAWSAFKSPYDMVTRMAPNLTHLRSKTDLMGGRTYPFRYPMKVFIEVPDESLRDEDGEDVERVIHDDEVVRSIGHDPQCVTAIGMLIPEGYDADCWESHWEAGLRGEPGHWPKV